MTSWGLENYHAHNKAILGEIIKREQPNFLIANDGALELNETELLNKLPESRKLFAEDLLTLNTNFIHHWGKIFVAGIQFPNVDSGSHNIFEQLIEGEFTLEAKYPALIDGKIVTPGNQFFLNQGRHILQGTKPDSNVTLRLGNNIYMPDYPAPAAPIYFGF